MAKSTKDDNIETIIDIVSRNDEKIKFLVSKHEELSDDLNEIRSELQNVKTSLEAHRLKIESLNDFWGKIFDSGWKLGLMILGAAILYFLRLQSPPN